MTHPSPTATPPRVVTAAFWLLLAAGFALVAAGALVAIPSADGPVSFRAAGALFAVAGAALVFLAGRARRGDVRFRDAVVALALALVAFLALCSLLRGGLVWPLIMVLILVGASLLMRPSASAWFDSGGRR
jgi:hypothetical protein